MDGWQQWPAAARGGGGGGLAGVSWSVLPITESHGKKH
jgi:hypothetical protein